MTSIIITCYEDDRKYLQNAIKSCFEQGNIEIIVVDGGSRKPLNDDCLLFADMYVYTRENIMQAGSVNLGVKMAKHDRIICLDADDQLYPAVIPKMEQVDADVVYGMMTNDWGGMARSPSKVDLEQLKIHNPIFWTSMFRKSAFDRVGGCDRILYQDYRFWIKMFLAGCEFKYIDQVIYNHTQRKGSLTQREYDRIEELNKEARQPLYEDNNIRL